MTIEYREGWLDKHQFCVRAEESARAAARNPANKVWRDEEGWWVQYPSGRRERILTVCDHPEDGYCGFEPPSPARLAGIMETEEFVVTSSYGGNGVPTIDEGGEDSVAPCGCGARWGGHSVCHCSSCHLTFLSVSSFDEHRMGRFEVVTDDGTVKPSTRRCRTQDELRGLGLEPNEHAYWRRPQSDEDAERLRGLRP